MSPESTLREPALVVLVSFILVGLFSYLPVLIPFLKPYSSVLIAAAFIYLPVLLIWRQGGTLDLIGVTFRPTFRQTATLVALAAIVFPLFTLGFFGYHALFFERSACIESSRLHAWPEELNAPHYPGTEAGPDRELVLEARADHKLVLSNWSGTPRKVTASWENARAAFFGRATGRSSVLAPGSVLLEPGDRLLWTSSGEATVRISGSGEIRKGAGETSALPYTANKGLWWLLTLLWVQLLMVALPEELFYRGYLQTRLARWFNRPVMVFGGDIGPAVLVSSAVFALGHLIAIPAATRLAVFFPSLLFGWLRSRTGSIWPAVVLHAVSNVVLAMLDRLLC